MTTTYPVRISEAAARALGEPILLAITHELSYAEVEALRDRATLAPEGMLTLGERQALTALVDQIDKHLRTVPATAAVGHHVEPAETVEAERGTPEPEVPTAGPEALHERPTAAELRDRALAEGTAPDPNPPAKGKPAAASPRYPATTVIRAADHKVSQVPVEELVPGDFVLVPVPGEVRTFDVFQVGEVVERDGRFHVEARWLGEAKRRFVGGWSSRRYDAGAMVAVARPKPSTRAGA